MRSLIILIGAFAILLSACSGSNSEFVKHNVTEGNFSIIMPTDIKKSDKQQVTPFGKQVTHFVNWKPSTFAIDKFKLFEVSYTDCPSAILGDSLAINRLLDSSIMMRIRDFSESDIIDFQSIEFNGYPGRAFFYDAPKGNTIVTVKQCIAGNKLYDLVVVSKKNYSTNTEMNNFFNSFTLINK